MTVINMLKTIDSINYVTVREVDGTTVGLGDRPNLTIESHWNDCRLVVIRFGGVSAAVAGEDLIKAIRNSMNV